MGILYDASFLVYAVLPFVVLLWLLPVAWFSARFVRNILRAAYFSAIYAIVFLSVAEILFWDEFGVRFNFIAVDYLVYRREVTDNIFQSYPAYTILFLLLAVSGIAYWRFTAAIEQSLKSTERAGKRLSLMLPVLFAAYCIFVFLDQDQRARFQNVYAKELASNGAYQFVAAFRNNELDYRENYALVNESNALSTLKNIYSGEETRFASSDLAGIERAIYSSDVPKNYNVVLIMVESLSAKYLSYFGNREQLTPNLDALGNKSHFFTHMYATGTRTTRGLEAVTLSIPPTPGRSIVKRIGREVNLWSLGNVLADKGYAVKFLYGGRGYFDNMSAFFTGNGYDVIDQSSIPNRELEFTNAWGMSDEDLYKVTLSVADSVHAEDRLFFLQLMTTSNHRPYTYPKERIGIASGSGRAGAVMYTDFALGGFLREAKQHDWFDNTVFVILADHTAGSAGKVDLPLDKYHIPMWVYAPEIIRPQKDERLISQIDVAPSILGLLNINYRSKAFGQDVFKHTPDRALIANYQNLGYYDGASVTILKPNQKIERYLYQGTATQYVENVPMDESRQRASAYYQVAAFSYHNALLSWQDSPTENRRYDSEQ